MKDHTIEVLKGIRSDIGALREDLNARVDALREDLTARLDGQAERMDKMDRRMVETEIRLATELVAVATAVREVRDVLIEDRGLRSQVHDHEQRLQRLERAG
jgi:hypothetical protein